MVIRGRIENGVVVFQPGVSLPEGTEVSVVVRDAAEGAGRKMSAEQRRQLRETLEHFEALPDENPGDAFRVADHDRVLYGDG